MANAPRTLITHALEDLGLDDLPDFTALLREPREDNLKPERFRKGQVQGKTFRELADLMVDAFALEAVPVTIALLRAINKKAVADDLEEEAAKHLPAPKSQSSGGASGSAAHNKPDATAEEEHFVDRHRDALIKRVSNTGPILDHLFQKKILQQEQYDEAMDLPLKQDKMRFLFRGPLRSGGKRSKDVLLTALEVLEPCLIEDLKEKEG